ncbi:DNA cytosine methyltransferase, partial [Acinetobacter baumannii]
INHDVAFGVDRLKAIGNGQVPFVAKSAFEYLGGINE